MRPPLALSSARRYKTGRSNGVGNARPLASVGERHRRFDQVENGFGDGRGHCGAGPAGRGQPKINAVVDYHPEDVLAHARAIDAAIARNEDLGPLAGVPVTVKVNIDQHGFATTNGLKLQRDVIAKTNSPVIDNLRKAGAVILGRTNCPAFSYRWFTTNLIHGATKNPRDPGITPGGSSGAPGRRSRRVSAISLTAPISPAQSAIRPMPVAFMACGRRWGASPPSTRRCPSVQSGRRFRRYRPLARSIGDLRIALAAMSGRDVRDPWWVPAPLEGPARPKRAALCLAPDGLEPVAEVEAAVADAGKRLERAGWAVEEIKNTPLLREAAELQTKLWLGDGYEAQLETAEREGDPGALACLRGNKAKVHPFDAAAFSKALVRRATLTREWQLMFETYSVLLMPVSGELPFPDGLDLRDEASFARVWRAQMPQIGIPFMGLPGLTVSTGLVGRVPVGVQIVSGRYREDLCLLAGEAIEAGGTPSTPVDPVS